MFAYRYDIGNGTDIHNIGISVFMYYQSPIYHMEGKFRGGNVGEFGE